MADKLHTLTSNIIRFSAGEKPSADKFNAANEYFARSLRDISKAIGDIRDQGYPHVSDANKYTHLTGAWNPYEPKPEGRPLDIVNLARLIGPASNLNPKMLRFDKSVFETIPGSVMEYELKYPYYNGEFIVVADTTAWTRVETYFTGTAQYKINNGIIYFSNESQSLSRGLYYETSSEGIFGGPNYEGASFNVIPDPNQPNKLSVVALPNEVNAYSIDLGNCTHQQSGIKSKESLLLSSLNAGEFNNGVELKLPRWMWQADLPEDLPRFENGDSIPEGFLVVKNLTTNEVYQNANYYFISPTEIHIKGVSLCVDHEFCVITVGTDITTSIDDLRNKLHLHKHDGSFGEGRVSVKSLIDKFSEYSSVVYGESSIPNNHFPMYLHRDGWSPDSNLNNGNNAMLGTLLMASVNFDSLNPVEYPVSTSLINDSFDSTGYETRSIAFGNLDCYIKRRDDGTLRLKNSDYKSINVEAGGVNLEAIYGINLRTPKTLEENGERIELDTQNIFSYSSDQTQVNSGRLIRLSSEENIESQSNKFEIEIKEKVGEEEYFKAYVNALDSDNDGSIILNKEKVELKQNNIDILSDNIILESKDKDVKYYSIFENTRFNRKRGSILQKKDSSYLKEIWDIDQGIETLEYVINFFDPIKADLGWPKSDFLNLLDSEDSEGILFNFYSNNKHISESNKTFIRGPVGLFKPLNGKEVLNYSSLIYPDQFNNYTTKILINIVEEVIDFKFSQYELIGNFISGEQVYNSLGNKEIVFNFVEEHNRNKKSLIINKSDDFADYRVSGVNYLIRFNKPKYVHYKMYRYSPVEVTEFSRNIFVDAEDDVNLLDICFSATSGSTLFFNGIEPHLKVFVMNALRFEIEVIENLNDAIINIIGRHVDA